MRPRNPITPGIRCHVCFASRGGNPRKKQRFFHPTAENAVASFPFFSPRFARFPSGFTSTAEKKRPTRVNAAYTRAGVPQLRYSRLDTATAQSRVMYTHIPPLLVRTTYVPTPPHRQARSRVRCSHNELGEIPTRMELRFGR